MKTPLLTRLVFPNAPFVAAQLERVRASGLVAEVPNLWQLTTGVLRMVHRAMYRPESIGTSRANPVRRTPLARLFQARPLRMPALFAVRALHPWDLSGLQSKPELVVAHLLGAHHDRNQFAYDLQILAATAPETLAPLAREAHRMAKDDTLRARFFRDLTVFETYHARLAEAVERAMDGDFQLTADEAQDPDISFVAYLAWCAQQPATPAETLAGIRAGTFALDPRSLGVNPVELLRAA